MAFTIKRGLFPVSVWMSLVFFVLTAMLVLISWLPELTEQFLFSPLLRKSGLNGYQVSVYRLGLGGCTLQVSGKPGSDAILAAGIIQADWSLGGLFKRRLDRLSFDGLQIDYGSIDQGRRPAFMTYSTKAGQQRQVEGRQPGIAALPFAVDLILINNSFVTFQDISGSYSLPFSLSAKRIIDRMNRKESSRLIYEVRAEMEGHEITADISYVYSTRFLSLHFTGTLDLQELSRAFAVKLPPPVDIKGIADVTMQAEMQLAPFVMEGLQAELHLENLQFRYGEFSVHGEENQPAVISLNNSVQDGYLLQVAGLSVDGPLRADIQLDARIRYREDAWRWDGNAGVQPLDGQKIGREYVLTRVPPLTLTHEGVFQDRKMLIKIVSPKGEGGAQEKFVVEQDELHIKAAHLGIESQFVLDTEKSSLMSVTLLLSGEGISVTSPGLRFAVPHAQLSGEGAFTLQNDQQKRYAFSSTLKLADGSLTMEKQDVSLQGIQLEFSGAWPVKENRDAGVLQIQQILLRNTEMGHFRGTWDLSSEAITLQGELQGKLVPESTVVLHGTIRVPDNKSPLADFQFEMLDTPVSLEHFTPLVPELDSLSGGGLLNMKGQVTLYPGMMTGGLKLDFHEGNFEIPGSGLKAEGVRFDLDFPELSNWYTSPQQKLFIDRIANEKLVVTDIKSSFRIESLQSLFVEKISGRWSKGRVFTSSFRLQKGKQEFEAALFFDRLELAEILSQLGLAQAEGNGRLSGRVPISFSDGSLYVDDGFLYTVPGEKGILRVKKSEHLTAGIPTDVPQFSPLLFASAALRDFEYDWAKLHVLSEDENLILQLQIDGKPGERLPFRFDQQNNVFVRLEEGSSGGIDQPVKLDINFNVPVNELFRYQQQLMPILRKIR